jgi:hypothetical protein
MKYSDNIFNPVNHNVAEKLKNETARFMARVKGQGFTSLVALALSGKRKEPKEGVTLIYFWKRNMR